MYKLEWNRIDDVWNDKSEPNGYTYRAKVQGGWLVSVWAGTKQDQRLGGGITFVPDPGHSWKAKMASEG